MAVASASITRVKKRMSTPASTQYSSSMRLRLSGLNGIQRLKWVIQYSGVTSGPRKPRSCIVSISSQREAADQHALAVAHRAERGDKARRPHAAEAAGGFDQ